MTRRLPAGLCAALTLAPLATAEAVETRFWHVASRGEFEEADLDGVSVDADGVVRLAPAHELIASSDEIYFWELARRGDEWIVGTGDAGRVLVLDDSDAATPTVLADLDLLEVMALAVGKDGTVYAAGAPGGVVYAIDREGVVSEVVDTEQGVVWDLAVGPQGDLFVVTGETGRLYRVAKGAEPELLYESSDAHLTCLAMMQDGALVVGSSGDGLVCRVGAGDDVRVLYDAEEEEVRALAVAADGSIYAALNAAKSSNGDDEKRPSVYRIGAYGNAQRMWRARAGFIFGFALDREGRLVVGTSEEAALYRIETDSRRVSRMAEFEETSILSVVSRDRELVVSTGDPARAYKLSASARSKGTVVSTARDAGAEAKWSRIRWVGETPRGTSVRFETRTGNRGTPDETWSEWAAATASAETFVIESPPARFLQWRLALEGGGDASPAVARVVTSYREINLPPEMLALDVSRKDAELFAAGEGRSRSVRQKLPGGIEVDYSLPNDSGLSGPIAPGEAGWARGLRTISWIGTDPNGDGLTFTLEYRPIESERWLPLTEEITDVVYTWDTTVVPDGEYRVRVTASDVPDNVDGEALTDARVSSTFEIDNTPPEVKSVQAHLEEGDEVVIRARATDARSAIVRAEVTIDGREWIPATPVSGLLDAPTVELHAQVPAGSRGIGDPVVLRVTDEAGNQAVSRAFIR